jgi:hypothetical protein
VKLLHQRDRGEGFGEVWLPHALARKYPGASRGWAWQFVFPSAHRSEDSDGGTIRWRVRSSAPPRPRES